MSTKIVSDCADVSSHRTFQIRGPATVQVLLPTVESLTGGTLHSTLLHYRVQWVVPVGDWCWQSAVFVDRADP